MSTKQKNILILSITTVVMILLFVLILLSNRIPLNDDNLAGNTAGNLNNGGYFCESDERVFFCKRL